MWEKTKESTVWNIPPIRQTTVSGDFYAYILCLSCTYLIPILCHSPVPCHAHIIRHKTHTTQTQDNFPFVYDIFRLLAAAFTETVQIHRRPYILCLSCALLVPILCHTAHRQAHRPAVPIPHSPADHSPTLPHKSFPEIPQIPPLHRMTAQPNRRQKLKHEHPLPVTFILCLSCAFLVFMLYHGIQFHLLQLNRSAAAHISCVYLVFTMYLPCAYPVSFSAGKVIYQKYSIWL